jgi:predicted dehydrogenase
MMDDGADLFGGSVRIEEFAVCDQFTSQCDAFSRAVRGAAALEFPIENAVANMRVIDAILRAAQGGVFEEP